jgi:hypothetical protein
MSPQISLSDQRSRPDKVHFELLLDGYREELRQEPQVTERGKINYFNDEGLFWQKPSGQSQ